MIIGALLVTAIGTPLALAGHTVCGDYACARQQWLSYGCAMQMCRWDFGGWHHGQVDLGSNGLGVGLARIDGNQIDECSFLPAITNCETDNAIDPLWAICSFHTGAAETEILDFGIPLEQRTTVHDTDEACP